MSLALLPLLAVLTAGAGGTTPAGSPVLVKDLEPAVTEPLEAVPTFRPLAVGSSVYFFQDDGIHGVELWTSDGSAPGTRLVADVCPGRCDGAGATWYGLVATGSTVFFAADDGVHGLELWVTDGSAAGTHRVKDLRAGAESSSPNLLLAQGGLAYFTADDGVHGKELWRSDGTEGGTSLFADLAPGSPGSEILLLREGPGLLFAGVPTGASAGVWRCDGTGPGTVRLTTAVPGQNQLLRGAPFQTLPDGRLLFAGTLAGDAELWISDGTVDGTHLLVDLQPGPTASAPFNFYTLGGAIYFTASATAAAGQTVGLWKTDGSAAGTVEIPLPSGLVPLMFPDRFGVVGSRAVFVAEDAAHGAEPWVLENDVVTLLRDLRPGAASSQRLDAGYYLLFAEAAGRVLFLADDGVEGLELWSTDGTPVGTVRLTSLAPGPATPSLDHYTYLTQRGPFAGSFYFRVADPLLGQRLWKSDGTSAGTGEVAGLAHEASSFLPTWRRMMFPYAGSYCAAATAIRFVFAAWSNGGSEDRIWGTDGSEAGTVALATLRDSAGQQYGAACASYAGKALFFAPVDGSVSLFGSDGTLPGTLELLSWVYSPGANRTGARPPLVDLGGRLVGTFNSTLVRTDATAGGSLGEPWGDLGLLESAGGRLFGSDYNRLVRSDGTATGTVELFAGDGETWPFVEELTALGNDLVFTATTTTAGAELWRSEGIAAGTSLLVDLFPGPDSAFHGDRLWGSRLQDRRLLSVGVIAILSVDDGVHGTELWRSDGTAAGTTLLKDIFPGSYPSTPRDLVRVGDVVYFAAEDDLHGLELWVTDGTSEGTHLVRDLVPGAESSVPQELTEVRGRLYFTAWRPAWGREAFQTDGSEVGTLQVADVWTGPESSSPSRFAAVRDTLYFAANDGVHGFELFKVTDPTLLFVFSDGFESGALAAWSRRTAP